MIAYAARRLLAAIPTLLAVLTLVFVIVRIVPGDPAYAILGDRATPDAVAALDARLGLDQPLWLQYVRFIGHSLTGDFGTSMATGEPILAASAPRCRRPSSSRWPRWWWACSPACRSASLPRCTATARSISRRGCCRWSASPFPVFVSGIFLLLAFALHWPLFPVIGDLHAGDLGGNLRKLVLPALTLGLVMAAYITRVTRSAMLQVLGEDYIRTARAKGVPRRGVVWRHGLRNAAMPVVTVVGLYVGILIGNSVLTEIVFNRPGLGSIIVGALNQRDYTMLQGLMVDLLLPDRGGEPAHRHPLRRDRSAGAGVSASAAARPALLGRLLSNASALIGLVFCVIVLAGALLAPWIAPHDPIDQDILNRLAPPSLRLPARHRHLRARRALAHPVGRAHLARRRGGVDRRRRSWWAAAIGMVSGYVGGRSDLFVMQVMDVLLSFPSLILGLIVGGAARPGAGQPHLRHRADRHRAVRAHRARAGAVAEGARLRRGRARARLLACCASCSSTSCPTS